MNAHTRSPLEAFDPSAAPVIDLVHVIYPDDYYVPEDTVLGWAHDELVNLAVDDHVKHHGPIPDGPEGERIYDAIAAATARPTDVAEARAVLDDSGRFTFARF